MSFTDLASSRRAWIDDVLIPWCRTAPRKELLKAEADWANVAGQVDAEATLWTWAWSRFAGLVHPEMGGLDESREVEVRLADGRTFRGYPDARRSQCGELVLLTAEGNAGPFSIDEIAEVTEPPLAA
jgi:hypothetical protein